jgi:DNA-binding NtrC family response regulator
MDEVGHVLIADDEELISEVYCSFFDIYFQEKGFPVIFELFENGEDVRKRLLVDSDAYLITDNRMPGRTGLELAKEFGGRVPMWMIQGNNDDYIAREVLSYGVNCSYKPVGCDTLERIGEDIINFFRKSK